MALRSRQPPSSSRELPESDFTTEKTESAEKTVLVSSLFGLLPLWRVFLSGGASKQDCPTAPGAALTPVASVLYTAAW
jgi:hypothetical protein